MQLQFLGTSSGAPTRDRNVTGLALRDGGEWDLFDCGEGTQHRLLETGLTLAKLRRIFISHLHGDHCFGLFGLLGSRSMAGVDKALQIYGPVGLEGMVRAVLDASSSWINYPLEFHTVPDEGRRVVDDAAKKIDAVPLDHRVTSFAWHIQEKDRPGAFDAARAEALGVPKGPDFGRLQRGETVETADGRTVSPDEVLGAPRPGCSLIIAGDNRDPTSLLDRTGPVQLLVHEATYTEDVVAKSGNDQGHSTAARVGTAAAGRVDSVILTHFSPRYGREGSGQTVEDVRCEAAACYDGALHLAEDLAVFEMDSSGRVVRGGVGTSC